MNYTYINKLSWYLDGGTIALWGCVKYNGRILSNDRGPILWIDFRLESPTKGEWFYSYPNLSNAERVVDCSLKEMCVEAYEEYLRYDNNLLCMAYTTIRK